MNRKISSKATAALLTAGLIVAAVGLIAPAAAGADTLTPAMAKQQAQYAAMAQTMNADAAGIPAAEMARAGNAEASASAEALAKQAAQYGAMADAMNAEASAATAARAKQAAQYQAMVNSLYGVANLPVAAPAPIAQAASEGTAGYRVAIGILSALLLFSIAMTLTTARRRPRAAIA
jgi:hypothetical protein